MATKEERAEDFAFECSLLSHHRYDQVSVIEGYIKGCDEQEQITRKDFLDKACKWIHNHCTNEGIVDDNGYFIDSTWEDNFRRAMEVVKHN